MLVTSSLFWFPYILLVTLNFGLSGGILVEKWIEQHQDHFDHFNDKTWLMRYYENDKFYNQSGPIFIMISGEQLLTPYMIEADYMYEMAETYRAMMYTIEHRYYGKSHPVPDIRVQNLRYLSVSQALADIARFIAVKKRELNSPNAFTMVFGCSYAGNLAAWMRVEYPHLVQGALAHSAPIYVKPGFPEFFLNIENSIRQYDEKCAMNIKAAFSTLKKLLDSPEINSIKVKNDFKLYSPDFFQPSDISYMMHASAKIFGSAILDTRVQKNGRTSIENLCISMKADETKSSYYRLAEVLNIEYSTNDSCKFSDSLIPFLPTSWESETVTDRLWMYQLCTELGYFTTLVSPLSIFGDQVPLQYYVDKCIGIFGTGFKLDDLNRNIRKINRSYNSKLPITTNIIFMNGDLDPWRSLSVLSDLNVDSPAILIHENEPIPNRIGSTCLFAAARIRSVINFFSILGITDAAHCESIERDQAPQKKDKIVARCLVSFTIYEWLHEWLR